MKRSVSRDDEHDYGTLVSHIVGGKLTITPEVSEIGVWINAENPVEVKQ